MLLTNFVLEPAHAFSQISATDIVIKRIHLLESTARNRAIQDRLSRATREQACLTIVMGK